jgi:nucleotide-binding universal stress UspA family protein
MNVRPSILCPIDFSDASASALRTANAVAAHFGTRLIVLTVEDPLLTEALDLGTGIHWTPEETRREMERFAHQALRPGSPAPTALEYEVGVGKPAAEILRVSRERSCDLIVMSTHGLTGMRKLFFGSTTERVLRETTRPVLITPAHDPGLLRLEDARERVRRVLVPVDLSPASKYQVKVAAGLADALGLGLLLVHVLEPQTDHMAARSKLRGDGAARRASAEAGLHELLANLPAVQAEAVVVEGNTAEELATIASQRQAGLVVMCLHSLPITGPRMGSVTYRLLCMTSVSVLALPPKDMASLHLPVLATVTSTARAS